ncbi:hypothetical protein [Sphingomonas sp. CFBP9021]|uniref:hypothetical protein n=1 Tax=Sphingomonas sp. CFBP9021 TaxID=3096534 RepID=UPI002A6A4DAF|nr:hypothetical protein [Sphingomonas sp. CFBP9021]MDY0969051.1 hypothetical protein [Sphingomonas sp. CFBP9021]
MKLYRTTAISGALLSSACATLPAEEATSFQALSKANTTAFEQQVADEEGARLSIARRLLWNSDGVASAQDCAELDEKPCLVTYTAGGTSGGFVAPVTNSRAVLGSINRYADLMKQLAEAEDLADVKAKAEGAAGAASSLAALTGIGAIATPIIKAATLTFNIGLKEKRRKLLLSIAKDTHPAIAEAAARLTKISSLLAANVATASSRRVDALEQSIIDDKEEEVALRASLVTAKAPRPDLSERIEFLQTRRGDSLTEMIIRADDVNKSRRLKTKSFDSLVKGHLAIITKLENPHGSQLEAMKNISDYLTLIDEIGGSE